MSVRAEVFLACDVRRTTACEGRLDAVVALTDVAKGEAAVREQARDLAWVREHHGERVLDACAAYWEMTGYWGIGPPPPPTTPERDDWPAQLERWEQRQRERQAQRESPRRLPER